MMHGDDQGLRLPPKVAPIQAAIVPIFKNDGEKSLVMPVADRIFSELKAAGFEVKLDDREETPGFKFNDWEMRGVPGAHRDRPEGCGEEQRGLARRDMPGKAGKSFVPQDGLAARIKALMVEIHAPVRAGRGLLKANIHEVDSYDGLRAAVQDGWALVPLKDDPAVDARIKADMQATSRNFPYDQPAGEWICVVTGEKVTERALVAKAY